MQRQPWLTQSSIEFPQNLPITAHLPEIRAALAKGQVVVVAGETGSGKTTQLPKLALAMGRGCTARIGHTQPRRIAARSVAERLAEELKVNLGDKVGYQVRFQQKLDQQSYVKVMTDGILLAELSQDRLLRAYDTLIIDEAHERSLNIDFILGYLKWLLPKRPDLKVIITSATLDHQRFAAHFNHCPVIEVSGRGYPVDIIYQPPSLETQQTQDLAQMQGILRAIQSFDTQGDILVFLSGERDIRQTSEFLRRAALRHTEILPLFAKLTPAEQQKIFHPSGLRRIILATNVAETSLTIPNIHYVIDSGLARIKRYSSRSKIQRLPIEPISKASAKQRAGRCGRIAPGVCVRLYSEEEFQLREDFTQPEILRSNLANVILQMLTLKLGDVEKFPWLNAPETQYWRDAYQCLEELQAIYRDEKNNWRLTEIGRALAKIPVDPRLARMLVSAAKNQCLTEALVIVSALSVADIFMRPLDHRQAADEKHRLFFDKQMRSDFLTYLNLWTALHQEQQHLSNSKFRKFCESHFLSYLKFKEWQDLYHELKEICSEVFKQKIENTVTDFSTEVSNETKFITLHQSLLSGLLSNVAQKSEQGTYLATRLRSLKIFPGSALLKKSPAWLMAVEIVETKQVYARTIAAIDPAWIEPLAPHLIKKSYSEPHWDRRRGEVIAFEKVLFFGLPIIAKRRVRYAPIDPALAHEVFVREALAQRQLNSPLSFWCHNEKFLAQLETLEEMTRSRHFVPDDVWLYEFYQNKIPQQVCNQITLEKWFKQAAQQVQQSLQLTEAHLQNLQNGEHKQAYPTEFVWQQNRLKITYQFAPDSADDGVNLCVPLPLLQHLPAAPFDWLVPGLLEEKILAIFKGLPKELRKALMPIADAAKFCKASLALAQSDVGSATFPSKRDSMDSSLDFFAALAQSIKENYQIDIARDQLAEIEIPNFLKFNFKILEAGKVLAMGRDLLQLKQQFLPAGVAVVNEAKQKLYQHWPEQVLPEQIQVKQNQLTLTKYQALQAHADGVVMITSDCYWLALQTQQFGVAKLLQLQCQDQLNYVLKKLLQPAVLEAGAVKKTKLHAEKNQTNFHKIWQPLERYLGKWQDFVSYFNYALIFMTFAEDFWQIRSQQDFQCCVQTHQQDLIANADALVDVVKGLIIQLLRLTEFDIDLSAFIFSGFLAVVPWHWLERYPLYLAALAESFAQDQEAAEAKLQQTQALRALYQKTLRHKLRQENIPHDGTQLIAYEPAVCFIPDQCIDEDAAKIYYLIQEWQMNLLMPSLKPVETVSLVRLQKALQC